MLCWHAAVWMFIDNPESFAAEDLDDFIPCPVLWNDTGEVSKILS